MEQETFKYGDYKYKYYLVYEDRKTISLTVKPNLSIIVKCPHTYSEDKIEKFLKRKWNWLQKQLKDLKRFNKNKKEKEYISGESFLYLGRQYKLVVKKSEKNRVHFQSGRIILESLDVSKNKKILNEWYEKRAEQVFKERYRQMLKKFNYEFVPELALRKMEKRWGSFLTKKKVLLNPELIKAHKECIDYVIIHELCHMKHQNHSTNFYKLLESKVPHWKKVKEKLELRFL
jgi:predicted metal-dependent hydrolase